VKNLEADVVKVLIAAIGVAALYDLFVLNKGTAVVSLTQSSFKGFDGILGRLTGQKPPAGY
jgi:hypothetical protein